QGLLMAGVILTLPYWLMISESILSKWRTSIKRLFYLFLFILFICAPYLYLFQIQLATLRPGFAYTFYQSDALFSAWNFLKANPNNHHAIGGSRNNDLYWMREMVITDDLWVNLWTPAKTGLHVWIGHAHETPDYWERYDRYVTWRTTDKADVFNNFLDNNQITDVIITNQENQVRFENLADPKKWQKTFKQSQVSVWSKR
ncbi:MAG: hypothetical protein PHC53_03835, partial [Patescibacteria group bacterium]|nr:hypothetical protein [Patescibacteria group bacterium]